MIVTRRATGTGVWRRCQREVATLAVALLLGAGCAGAPAAGAPDALGPGAALVRSELFFGRLRPDGTVVSDAEWRAFVVDHVTPRFPDGFTVLDAVGQYRGRDGRIVTEPSKILLLLHPAERRSQAAIEELRAIYRRLFHQESVLRVTSPARAAF
jgi:hypothetical protein